jgi:hypothetical protein
MTTYVTFDTRSGQILSVHHGAIGAEEVRALSQDYGPNDAKLSDEYIEVISVHSDKVEKNALYKVDLGKKALVLATAQDGGVGFSFGKAGV